MAQTAEAREIIPGVPLHPQIVETPLGPVEYDITDGTGPVVLCSHGGIGGCDQGRLMLDWIDTSAYRLLSPSRPGYLGTPLESGLSIDAQADLLAALLDALGIDRVSLVSASAGGPIGYVFALRHRDRCQSLIAIDSVSGYYDLPETAGPIAQAFFTSQLGQKLLKFIGERKPQWFLQGLFQSEAYFTKPQMQAHIDFALENERVMEFVRGFMETMNPYAPRKVGTENDMTLYRELTHLPVEQIACPCLIIHGTHDADVKFYDGVYAYEHIPNAERFWIEEGSHLGFWISTNAQPAQNAARDFLDRTWKAPA